MAFPGNVDPLATTPGNHRRLTFVVLAVSFALRAVLAWRGGQFFWPDEDRFVAAQRAVRALAEGRWADAASLLFTQADHLLFRVISLAPAALERALGAPAWVPALFFAAVSTGVLWLVARAARALGGGDDECLLALVLAASASTLFYYSRHYFPYDLSLACLLLAVIASRSPGPAWRTSGLTGLWAGLGFLIYNGYWSATGAILVVHVLAAAPRFGAMLLRAGWAALGALLPVAAVVGLGRLLGHNLIAESVAFAGTVTQGDLGLAWRFVPEYLGVTEGGLAVLWALALLAAPLAAILRREPRHLVAAGLSLGLAALLILPSDVLGRFALSARHVRALVPFLCLATAGTVVALAGRRGAAALAGFALAQAAWHFATPLQQVFPRDFLRLADAHLAEARRRDLGPYAVLNAGFLHNPTLVVRGPDAGEVQLRRDHPFQFRPYLYEGYTYAARASYLAGDMSMRIVRLAAGGPAFTAPAPGPIELTLRFPERPFGLLPEPILTTGRPGRGDQIFIEYIGTDRFRLGHDNYGGGAVCSPVRPLDRTRPRRIDIDQATLDPQRRDPMLVVAWNDEVLINARVPLHQTAASEIDVGHNFHGFSTALPLLSADIEAVNWQAPRRTDAAFADYPGAIRTVLELPAPPPAGASVPLVQTGPPGLGDKLVLRHDGAGSYRVGHDHRGTGFVWSSSFQPPHPARLEFVVALDNLRVPSAPPAGGPVRPSRLFVACNGEILFSRVSAVHPTTPAEIATGLRQVDGVAAHQFAGATFLGAGPAALPPLAGPPADFPGVLRLRLRFFEHPAPGRVQPLLSAGRTGAADVVLIKFEESGRYRLGLDHWGTPLTWSEPATLDFGRPLELTVALGSLLPPATGPADPAAPLRRRLVVLAGDRPVFDRSGPLHPPLAGSLVVGANTVLATSAEPVLSADVLEVRGLSPQEILPLPDRP